MKLLIATNNPGKMREIQAILKDLPMELLTPAAAGLALDVEESGSTYAENAALKARAFANASGLVSLADDSGLEVEALGGEPGIRSARYAPQPGATDADRRAYLLERLRAIPHPAGEPGWRAHFHCTVAIATPAGQLFFAEGRCDGFIIGEERGTNGFGYDPLFFMPEWNATMAELSEETKNQISHRARALRNALPILQKLLRE
ncbi:MAG: RdgB/HAM1 family non-canonical purine NTP pyrophosphatase [Bellilinea sp.]|nr:RdgB/HAM1 family non-canonical purine NTP pyrophosphatase [Bellilinea sp.]